MKKSQGALTALSMLFCTALVLSNVVAPKVVGTSVPFPGGHLAFPGAVFCYAITFLATDIVGEIWGRREAGLLVAGGFAAQICASAMLLFTQALPAADPAVQRAYETLLGQNWLFALSSLAAYTASQSWDVFAFHAIRRRILASHPGALRLRWIWNNASTVSSQFLDTVVFVGLSFGIGLGWLFDPERRHALFYLALGQYVVKIALAALDTIPFMILTGGMRRHPSAPARF